MTGWMKGWAPVLLALAGGVQGAPAAAQEAGWRQLATPADRSRLRRWRTAWTAALARARTTRDGAAAIAGDPELFAPDRALPRPLPPDGDYRCRTIKLGRQGDVGLDYVAYPWFRCRVFDGRIAKVDGSQRLGGRFHADTDARAVVLGTLVLGDERKPIAYGRDGGRDMAGLVERIGPERWRVAFPYPAYESLLDVLELRPAGQGRAMADAPETGGSAAR